MLLVNRSSNWRKLLIPLGALLAVALLARLLWIAYTHYTAEDAFITFRYSQNLIAGNGFTYNPGERIYGTTTPLFTLVMAGWLLAVPDHVTFGAYMLNVLAALGSLALVFAVLRRTAIAKQGQWLGLGILAIAAKVCVMDTQGMETPVVVLFMMASWYAFALERPVWVGLWAGLLLWTRIDLVVWVAALAFVEWRTVGFKNAFRLVLVTTLVYLPWLIFASLYFGSPIPYTITAKWVAYGGSNSPLYEHLATVVAYLSPFDLQDTPALIAGCITLGLAAWQVIRLRKDRLFLVLLVFAILELTRLVVTRTTFFNRYFVPLLWFTLILAAIGLVSLWQSIQVRRRLPAWIPRVMLAAGVVVMVAQDASSAELVRSVQAYRHEAALRTLGLWLNDHAREQATVLLEPLGYAGYYSKAKMLDDVGLITPKVVDLKRQGVPLDLYFAALWPDYFVTQCDGVLHMKMVQSSKGERFIDYYARAVVFNPLGFEADNPDSAASSNLSRRSCYEVWQRTTPPEDTTLNQNGELHVQ